MSFWRNKSLWLRECSLGIIFVIFSLVIFVKTNDLARSLIFFVQLFALTQPFLLAAYFMDKKFGRRKR